MAAPRTSPVPDAYRDAGVSQLTRAFDDIRRRGHPYADPGPERQRRCRAVGRHRAPRMPGPSPDHRPPPPRSRPAQLRQALQPPSSRPQPRPVGARVVSAPRQSGTASRQIDPPPRCPRRPDPRIRTRSMTSDRFLAPHGTGSRVPTSCTNAFTHPTGIAAYQVSRAQRCADRHLPRSCGSVKGEGMRS